MKFLIVDTFHPALQQTLEEAGHLCLDMSASPLDEVMMALPFADGILLRSRFALRQDLIDRCPALKIIGRVGAGLEHIDVDYARTLGIHVVSSPEGNRQAVAEHALALLLALLNHVPKADLEVRSGQWLRKQNEGTELQGKTVGIIGYGHTGSAFAQVLSGFGVRILAYDKYVHGHAHIATMEQVFAQSDVVSIHLPLTEETRYLVCTAWLDRFANPIYLINTSRGPIVNTSDLLRALDREKVLGACLDVLEYETESLTMPPMDLLPETAQRLFAHPRTVLSPHIAGITKESYEKLSRVLAEKILAVL